MKDENLIGCAKKATDFLGNHYKYDCMGCSMTKGEIVPPGGFVYETEYFLVGQDPEIPIEGFLVINSKRHVNSLTQLSDIERHQLVELLNIGISAIKSLKITTEVTLVQEERSKHFHVWIFPNQPWMLEKFGKGVSYLRDISAYAQENSNKEGISNILNSIEKIRKYYNEHFKWNI